MNIGLATSPAPTAPPTTDSRPAGWYWKSQGKHIASVETDRGWADIVYPSDQFHPDCAVDGILVDTHTFPGRIVEIHEASLDRVNYALEPSRCLLAATIPADRP